MKFAARLSTCAVTLSFLLPPFAHADSLASLTGKAESPAGSYVGEEITISGTGQFNDIDINLYTYTPGSNDPFAFGTLYILTALPGNPGSPSDLSTSLSSYVGSAAANQAGTAFDFGPDVVLTGGDSYYLFDTDPNPVGLQAHEGGTVYSSTNVNVQYGKESGNFSYAVTGTPYVAPAPVSATPEPSSLLLLATGSLGILGSVRRRFRLKK